MTIIKRKPNITPAVPAWVCSPKCACGISSSTTTYNMAPAANDNSHGMTNVAPCTMATVAIPAMGSTIPLKEPYRNALPFEHPSFFKGSEIAAPSGKFCKPMPRAKEMAAAYVTDAPVCKDMANASPTAMPSGILCNVTANTSKVVRFSEDVGPSGFSLPGCR